MRRSQGPERLLLSGHCYRGRRTPEGLTDPHPWVLPRRVLPRTYLCLSVFR